MLHQKLDRTGLERRLRNERRSKLDEYITCRVSIRNSNIPANTPQDNQFINSWLEKYHASTH